ncbi:RNA-binding protein 44 [Tachysurus fulvidraco]|uniref:RNA-binding protein 44 n=1 Tax=Tachysurus fulvidraco TaxID=1234273 RepID=UPI001FEF8A24|nr:RNA-binding protein 44 [Tachysurus fulvidraco]
MWYPPPVSVPFFLEPNARRSANVPAPVMWPPRPFDQQWRDMLGNRELGQVVEDTRKLLLRSLYELVKMNHFLELTDPKLIGWYLSLPAEGLYVIQEVGGLFQFLHRHPALEVSRNIVHLKQNVVGNCLPLAADMPSRLHESRRATFYGISGAKNCKCCSMLILNSEENVSLHEEEKTLQLLPNNLRAELNLESGQVSEDMDMRSQQYDYIQSTSTNLSVTQSNILDRFQKQELPRNSSSDGKLLCQIWEEKAQCDGNHFRESKDKLAQASVLLDGELEMQSHTHNSDHDQVPLLTDTNSDLVGETSITECYSFNSTTVGHTSGQWSDVTNTSIKANKGSTEASTNDEPGTSGTKTCTFSDSFFSNPSERTNLTGDVPRVCSEEDLKCETNSDEYHNVNKKESSISAACVPCINPSWSASGQSTHESVFTRGGCISSTCRSKLNIKTTTTSKIPTVPLSVSQTVDPSSDFKACFTSNRATEVTQDDFVKHCQDVSTGKDLCPVNQETQTIQGPTSEKGIITEVYMSDLDALCEEFEKLKMMEEELMLLKKEMPSATGPRSEQSCGCGAVSRARWAELRLLALQFAMCQQHCWRRFYTSYEGETSLQGIETVPDAMSQTLKSLEDNYLKMKRKILDGFPLDNLKPLAVDTKRLTAATCYRPSLIYKAFLGVGSSFKPSSLKDEGQTNQATEDLKINTTDHEHFIKNTTARQGNSATPSETVSSMRSRIVPASSQQPGVSIDSKPDSGARKEINSSDAWYDAEEEFGCGDQSCKEDRQIGLNDQGDSQEQNVDPPRKIDRCFLLCVLNLPNTVTEHDLLLWFAKYHTNKVSLSNFTNTRVAIVSVRNSNDAEAAVREMNGQRIQGHTLHVEHIHKPPADDQVTMKESCVQHSPATHKAGEELIPLSSDDNFHASRPLHCSLDKLTNVCTTPTASGTFVPQHYGTMGSFDTIMAQLSERYPKIGRQQIVSALLELQKKHCGVLGGLPLRDIVDMTSDLLTHSATD